MSNLIQFIKIRNHIHQAVVGLSHDECLKIPSGFDNNIAWNLGHIITTQQRLHYVRVEATPYVSEDFMAKYVPGTSPADWSKQPDVDELRSLLVELPEKFKADYPTLKTRSFQGSTTGSGIPLATLDDTITFNMYHDGLHWGFIQALKNLVVT